MLVSLYLGMLVAQNGNNDVIYRLTIDKVFLPDFFHNYAAYCPDSTSEF